MTGHEGVDWNLGWDGCALSLAEIDTLSCCARKVGCLIAEGQVSINVRTKFIITNASDCEVTEGA